MASLLFTFTYAISVLLVVLLSWIVASVAILIATNAISRKISLQRAMYISFVAVIVFIVLEIVFGILSPLLGLLLGLLGVLYIIKTDLHTGWSKAFVIAVIALIVFVVLEVIVSAILGVTFLAVTGLHFF